MALKNYNLVVGKPIDWALDDDDSPHIEVLLDVEGEKFRAAINVRSKVAPHTLGFKRIEPFDHKLAQDLAVLNQGVYDLKNDHASLALDYVRDDIIEREQMEELPYSISGPDNDLKDKLVPLVEAAIASSDSTFYLFGETWGPEIGKPDKYFHFTPGRGVHDIHMNQGSQGRFASSNGIHQDGGLIIQQNGVWTAIFLAFSSQSWNTDDRGNNIGDIVIPTPPVSPTGATMGMPLRIVAALVNPYNPEPGKESVTLLNVSDQNIRLNGWKLQDGNNRSESLDGFDIGAGDSLRVRLSGQSMRLKNRGGGKIRLISPDGILLQEIVYQKEDVRQEGWSFIV